MLEREVLNGTRPDLDDLPHITSKNMRQLITDCWAKDRTLRWTAQQCFAALNKEYDSVATTEFDIFFSHRWNAKPFLSHVYMLLCEKGYKVQSLSGLIIPVHYLAAPHLTSILYLQVWYDVNEMGYDLRQSMKSGIENSKVVLACMDAEYQKRDNCMLELRHAHECVIKSGHCTKAILAVMMEDGISWGTNWGTDEVKDILDTRGKMFVSLHALNTPAWESADGPTEEMLQELRDHAEMTKLYKLLDELVGHGPINN